MSKSVSEPQFQFEMPVEQVHFSNPIAWRHTFYLGMVEEPQAYIEWFEIIRNAGPQDEIIFNINSIGGVYYTAVQLRRAIMESMATITCNIEGECHSAASLIYLCADNFSVSEGSNMLLHDYSGFVRGKGSDMVKQIQHEKVMIDSFIAGVYKGFLTDEEIKRVLSGEDMWLDSEEIIRRTELLISEREKEILAQQDEEEESQDSN